MNKPSPQIDQNQETKMGNLDLRTLKILLSLYDTGNTYRTAEHMNLSQSAVSRTLIKCRGMLNDPLFIRKANKLLPTAMMEHLAPKLPGLIIRFEDLLESTQAFNPETLTGQYRLCLNNQIKKAYGTHLFAVLSSHAPNATWHINSWDENTVDRLLDQQVVMGVNYRQEYLPQSIAQDVVFEDELVLLANSRHPLHGLHHVSSDQLSKYDFISESTSLPNADAVLDGTGITPNVRLHTDCINLAMKVAELQPLLLPSSNGIARQGRHQLHPIHLRGTNRSTSSAQIACIYSDKVAMAPVVQWLKQVTSRLHQAQSG